MNTAPSHRQVTRAIVAIKTLSANAQSLLDQARALADFMDTPEDPDDHPLCATYAERAAVTCALKQMVISRRAEKAAEAGVHKCASR